MNNEKLSVAEDRKINGWNPPASGKLKYILASVGPAALGVGLSMGPGSIGSALKLGALSGYRMLWVMLIIALAMAAETYITNYIIYGSHIEGEKASTLIQLFNRKIGKIPSFIITAPVALAFCFVLMSQGTLIGTIVHDLLPFIPAKVAMVLAGPVIALLFSHSFDAVKKIFKYMIGFLTLLFLVNGIVCAPNFIACLKGLVPSLPKSSGEAIAFAGVVGGSCGGVTFILQSYGIRNSGLTEKKHLPLVRIDTLVTCLMFFVWNIGIYISAAAVLNPAGVEVKSALQAALALEPLAGSFAKYIMLLGILAACITSAGGVCTLNSCIIADVLGKEPNPKENPWMKKINIALCLVVSLSIFYGNFSSMDFVVAVMSCMTLAGPFVCIGILYLMLHKDIMKVKVPTWQILVTILILGFNLYAAYNALLGLIG